MRISGSVGPAFLGFVLAGFGLIWAGSVVRAHASPRLSNLDRPGHYVVDAGRRSPQHLHHRRYQHRQVVIVGPSYWRHHRVVYVYRRPYYYRPYNARDYTH
jgi:hypothetical protein